MTTPDTLPAPLAGAHVAMQGTLFPGRAGVIPRAEAMDVITSNHYLHSFPSGWTFSYRHLSAVVVFSIPANKNLGPFLFGKSDPLQVRELARLWAPDGHPPNLLTAAISRAVSALRSSIPVDAVISFADPNQGHHGGIYQAASWIYTGQSSETRVYRTPDGRTVSRRSFHSGNTSLPPSLPMVRLLGKHRYVRCLNRRARRRLLHDPLPYPKETAA